MSFQVTRRYKDGTTATVSGNTMKELIEKVAQVDDLFWDNRAFAKDDSGSWVEVPPTEVKFQVRHAKTRDNKPCKYFEQVCTQKGPALYFKRHIGEFQERPGEMYVKRSAADEENVVAGGLGWYKYVGTDGEQGQSGNRSGGYSSDRNDRGNSNGGGQAPRQQPAPQQQYAPAASYSNDDIPF